MSNCISRHGEFSEHHLDDSHTCTLCHVLDEEALRAELARLRAALADPRRDPMYHDRYWQVQEVLDEALGPNEEDGTGQGIVAEVALVVQQREEAIAERDRYREHSTWLNTVGFKLAEALGDVPPGADAVAGNPIEQAERLIAKHARLLTELDAVVNARNELWVALNSATAELAAAKDTAAIQPCQPIGCDNGYHLPGCWFADIDAQDSGGHGGHNRASG